MEAAETEHRLTRWLASQLPEARDLRITGLDPVAFGHSSETLLLTVRWSGGDGEVLQDAVIRIRPPTPGLLEPYDLNRQFAVLRILEPTPVRAPRPLWLEPTGQVLGREFYVMERLPGTVYERGYPEEFASDPALVNGMCESFVSQLAAIHSVELTPHHVAVLGDGHGYVERELTHWTHEVERVRRGPTPALTQLAAALRERRPEPCPLVTMVHGDAKPGNFAFEGATVSGVLDWEMATTGDPLADIGWAEVLWSMPGYFTSLPDAMTTDQLVARWEELTGIGAVNRPWYRAFQAFKMAAILLVGGHLFDAGFTDDSRFAEMTYSIHPLTLLALRQLGIDDALEAGPVLPRDERVDEVKAARDV